ncbi:hypothetical protein CEE37_06570 [candidate division LCP-89 bacterium B3_LCP]|uniref:SIS domain-containing protein n=1 Tax=candidate division LCP-89 bacterium B3_LCP TaxID=2012998 RepID=A0A532V084_UNCL8|nr:MAG: hypothetical protein CEE37_06570 [candidate division LCP-89 bacterium B3_LCP]
MMHDRMWTWLDEFPEQIRQADEMGKNWDLGGIAKPSDLTFLGIGGSAIGATLVCDLFSDLFTRLVNVVRGEFLPNWIGEGTIVVAISYSGETRETLAAFEKALDRGAQGISISSGGRLAELASERGCPHLMIPGGMAPRAALGYTSIPLIYILQRTQLIPLWDGDLDLLSQPLNSIRLAMRETDGTAYRIAQRISRRLPMIVGAGITSGVARRFQAQLAENASALSICLEVPEALHNIVETLNVKSIEPFRPVAIFLDDPQAPESLIILLEQLREHIQEIGIEIIRVTAEGDSPLERLYTLIYKTDWISYHLAILKGIDPVAIPIITEIKQKQP